MRFPQALVVLLAALVTSNGGARLAHAEVIRVDVARRVDIQGGRYELIEGRILFAVGPANRYNARIVDLERAPRNAAGSVRADSSAPRCGAVSTCADGALPTADAAAAADDGRADGAA